MNILALVGSDIKFESSYSGFLGIAPYSKDVVDAAGVARDPKHSFL